MIVKSSNSAAFYNSKSLIIIGIGLVLLIESLPSVYSKIENLQINLNSRYYGDESESHNQPHHGTIGELKITETPPETNGINKLKRRSAHTRAGEEDNSDDSVAIRSTGCSSEERSCCLQYTWPGTEKTLTLKPEDPTSNISRTCADVKLEDPGAACFDPIVYAYSNSSRRPNPQLVIEYCRDNSEPCFCLSATCLKYTLYNNDDEQSIINETHFCGTVTQTNNDDLLSSGCYKESRSGRIYEICVCRGHHCNSANINRLLTSSNHGWIWNYTILLSNIFIINCIIYLIIDGQINLRLSF